MSYEVFWKLDPRKLKPFIEAFKQSQKLKQEETNMEAWIQGIYFQQAIASCFNKDAKYPEKPINFSGEPEPMPVIVDKFEALTIMWNQERRQNNGN